MSRWVYLNVEHGDIYTTWCDEHARTEPVIDVYCLDDEPHVLRIGTYWIEHGESA